MATKKLEMNNVLTLEDAPTGCALLAQVVAETARARKIKTEALSLRVVAERRCCGVWEKIGTATIEAAVSNGKLMLLGPVDLPSGWQRFTISCQNE